MTNGVIGSHEATYKAFRIVLPCLRSPVASNVDCAVQSHTPPLSQLPSERFGNTATIVSLIRVAPSGFNNQGPSKVYVPSFVGYSEASPLYIRSNEKGCFGE